MRLYYAALAFAVCTELLLSSPSLLGIIIIIINNCNVSFYVSRLFIVCDGRGYENEKMKKLRAGASHKYAKRRRIHVSAWWIFYIFFSTLRVLLLSAFEMITYFATG